MRKLFSLLAALLPAVAPAVAQTTGSPWRPFRVGHTYTYALDTADRRLETVRLAEGRVDGADSVYRFAPFYRRANHLEPYPPQCVANPGAYPIFRLEPNTSVGAELCVPAASAPYELRFTDDTTRCRLPRPPYAVGQTWQLTSTVSATVTTLETQLIGTAGLPDSVMVASLNTGGELVLSKSYGLILTPHLRELVTRGATTRSFELLTIPERALGGLPDEVVIDWQPGDSLLWTHNGPSICEWGYSLTRYLSRQLSATGDSVVYHGTIRSVDITYGAGCANRQVIISPPMPFRRARYIGPVGAGRGQLLRQADPVPGYGYVNTGVTYRPPTSAGCFGGWRWHYQSFFSRDTCRQTLDTRIDFGSSFTTTQSFGQVHAAGAWGDEGNLVWYRTGNQTCGTRGRLDELLATPALLPAEAVQLFPNPAATTARLTFTGTRGGPLTLTATDALGRRVWQRTQAIGPEADVALPTAAWAPGVYYVRVSLLEGARTLRLVRE